MVSRNQTLSLFLPPYQEFLPCDHDGWPRQARRRGAAFVWQITQPDSAARELEIVRHRPRGVSLIIILPPASEIYRVVGVIRELTSTMPRGVLPSSALGSVESARNVLASCPRDLPLRVMQYLTGHGVLPTPQLRNDVLRIFELAPHTPSIQKLCRQMYTSRRTLGRHFDAHDLPVPSHWLQFARLLHLAIRIPGDRRAIFRLAAQAGYPDGFTMSNQMKRLLGLRPTELRQYLGYEWIIEEWLERERGQTDLEEDE